MKYQFKTEIIDNETGEILDICELYKNVENINLEELAERVVTLKQLLTEINGIYRTVEFNFIREMNSIEAKKYLGKDFDIQLNKQTEYEYDTEYVHRLKELISEEQFNNVFTEKYKVNRTYLKGVINLGGEIKELAELMQTKIDRKPTIVVTNKK